LPVLINNSFIFNFKVKRFLIQAIFFFLPIALFSYSADVFISKELKKNHFYTQGEYSIWNDILDGKVNSEIVIYGDSRAARQINPNLLSDSFNIASYNLGILGHNFKLQNLRHSLLLKHNIKPQLIIFSLDVFTLAENQKLFNADQFLPYMFSNDEIKNTIINYEGYNYIDYHLPLIRYYGKKEAIKNALKLFINPASESVTGSKGYKPEDEVWISNPYKEKKIYLKLDTALISLFENFLNECNTKKIKIAFVYAPEYIERRNTFINREEVFNLYNMFSKKYSIRFYDFSNDTISYKKKYFYNVSHLNKTGAELFTNKLIDTLKKTNIFNF